MEKTQTQTQRADPQGQPVEVATARVLRVTRYPIDVARRTALEGAFGDVEVVDIADVHYGDSPVGEILELVERFADVVAIELVAPPEVLAAVTQAKIAGHFADIQFLKAEFVRGNTGRPAAMGRRSTSGEDVLLFSHYVVLEEVRYSTSPLKKRA